MLRYVSLPYIHGHAKAYARPGRCTLTTPWISFPCSPASGRWRYGDDGKVEVEGAGLPSLAKGWPSGVNQWSALIGTYADRYGLPHPWVAGLMAIESGGNQKACSPCSSCDIGVHGTCCTWGPFHLTDHCSDCCAHGLLQLTTGTAAAQAKVLGLPSNFDIWDPETNVALGVSYFRGQVDRYKDFVHAAVGYNAGSVRCIDPKHCTKGYWGVCTDGSAYPLLAIQACNAAIDNGFPLSGPLPDLDHLPPVPLPHRTIIPDLSPFTRLIIVAAGAYAGYWVTKRGLQPRSRVRRDLRDVQRGLRRVFG